MTREVPKIASRQCNSCHTEYQPASTSQKYCVLCRDIEYKNKERISNKLWKEANRGKISHSENVRVKKSRMKDPTKRIFNGSKSRAKERGLEFTIRLEDLKNSGVCPVFNQPFTPCTEYAMSIDRIDNTKGYTKDNIQVISRKANSMKSDATPEQLLKFADWIYQNYKN